MKRWLLVVLLLGASAAPVAAQKFAPLMVSGGAVAPPVAYSGPGDIVASPGAYGTRAYSAAAAAAGAPLLNVCNSTGGIDQLCVDLVAAPDGTVVPPSGCVGGGCQTYYLTTTGSDRNNGLSPTSTGCPAGSTGTCGPWYTVNHALNCSATGGDVILVQPGVYTDYHQFGGSDGWTGAFGPPGNGCSGHGVFRTVKCNGNTLGSCILRDPGGNGAWIFFISTPYWIIQGFQVTTPSLYNSNACLVANARTETSHPHNNGHDVVFINNWVHDCGRTGMSGTDYVAYIGALNYNTGGNATDSAVDFYEPMNIDTLPGTHIFLGGIFVFKSTITYNDTDGEGIIFDDFDCGQRNVCRTAYTQQAVVEQSIIAGNASNGIQIFWATRAHNYLFSSTFYDNSKSDVSQGNAMGEVVTSQNGTPLTVDHVIAVATKAHNTGTVVANFTGSVSGTVLTAGNGVWPNPCSNFGGYVAPNAVLSGAGIPTSPPVHIVSQATAQLGVCGTYNLETNLGTIAAKAMHSKGKGANYFSPYFNYYAFTSNFSSGTINYSNYYNTGAPATGGVGKAQGDSSSTGWTIGSGNVQNQDPQFTAPAIPGGTFGVGGTGPDCSQDATVIACMQRTGVIANFTTQNPAVASMGYHPPGACGTDPGNAYIPTTGTNNGWIPLALIPPGLITLPCN